MTTDLSKVDWSQVTFSDNKQPLPITKPQLPVMLIGVCALSFIAMLAILAFAFGVVKL